MKPDHIPLVSHDHQYFYQQDLQQQQQQQMVFSDHAPARLFTSARANLFDLHRNNRHFRGELNNESRTGYAEEDEDEEEEEGENLDGVDQDDQEEEEKEEKEEMLDECEEEKCCLNASTQHHLHIYSDHQ